MKQYYRTPLTEELRYDCLFKLLDNSDFTSDDPEDYTIVDGNWS